MERDPVAVGTAAAKRKDWVAAERAFQEALRLRPSDVHVLVDLALTLEQLGRRQEAEHLWLQVQQLDPELSRRTRRRFAHGRSVRFWVGVLVFALATALTNVLSAALLPTFNWTTAVDTTIDTLIALAVVGLAVGALVGTVVLLKRIHR